MDIIHKDYPSTNLNISMYHGVSGGNTLPTEVTMKTTSKVDIVHYLQKHEYKVRYNIINNTLIIISNIKIFIYDFNPNK